MKKKITETNVDDIYMNVDNTAHFSKITNQLDAKENKQQSLPRAVEEKIKKDVTIFCVVIGFVIAASISSTHNIAAVIPFFAIGILFSKREYSIYQNAINAHYCICYGTVQKAEFDGIKIGGLINHYHYNITILDPTGLCFKFQTKDGKKYVEGSPISIYIKDSSLAEQRGSTVFLNENDFLAVTDEIPEEI